MSLAKNWIVPLSVTMKESVRRETNTFQISRKPRNSTFFRCLATTTLDQVSVGISKSCRIDGVFYRVSNRKILVCGTSQKIAFVRMVFQELCVRPKWKSVATITICAFMALNASRNKMVLIVATASPHSRRHQDMLESFVSITTQTSARPLSSCSLTEAPQTCPSVSMMEW